MDITPLHLFENRYIPWEYTWKRYISFWYIFCWNIFLRLYHFLIISFFGYTFCLLYLFSNIFLFGYNSLCLQKVNVQISGNSAKKRKVSKLIITSKHAQSARFSIPILHWFYIVFSKIWAVCTPLLRRLYTAFSAFTFGLILHCFYTAFINCKSGVKVV